MSLAPVAQGPGALVQLQRCRDIEPCVERTRTARRGDVVIGPSRRLLGLNPFRIVCASPPADTRFSRALGSRRQEVDTRTPKAWNVGPGMTRREGRGGWKAKEGVGKRRWGEGAAPCTYVRREKYPFASQCPELLSRAPLGPRPPWRQLLGEGEPRCKACADHLTRAIWPVPSAANASSVLCSTRRPALASSVTHRA